MNTPVTVSILGLGEMGRALASALLRADRSVVVWNRTPGKGIELAEAGVQPIAMVQRLIAAERDSGHGTDSFARIVESIAHPTPEGTFSCL
ncbi:MAG TPA: NAD(P)-binding domain-containing protein [Rhodococcus sp. (in: high G+C Gram-positive bacteria)]|jgi:glycerol-3-phosphate dehydrogenase|nr:NAD(P)-binding domain-containing protein [Rhodococcus sp. (in: high G+C Gram-positive bacteria)]